MSSAPSHRRSIRISIVIVLMSVLVRALIAPFSTAMPQWKTVEELNEKPSLINVQKVHLVVLVHGWMGNPSELSYLHESLQTHAMSMVKSPKTRVVVHSATCNDGKTSDGIPAGGTRLAQEINQLINQVTEKNRHVSLSIIGNSLGGLYARYALSGIPAIPQATVTPKVFCTTATPHLGVSQRTYIPLPRTAEVVVAQALRDDSLRDMFRTTRVLDRMAYDPAFIQPLQAFRHRLAYANAYYTDFQVPTATAAFLSSTDSPHQRTNGRSNPGADFVELCVTTPSRSVVTTVPESEVSLEDMASQLDALGWTKVFCDVRSSLPTLIRWPWRDNQSDSPKLIRKDLYTAQELLNEFATFDWQRWHAPLGHTVLVANSKNAIYRRINAGGQAVMDHLAKEVLEEILDEEDIQNE